MRALHTSYTCAGHRCCFFLNTIPAPQGCQNPPYVGRHLDSSTNKSQVRGRFIDIDVLETLLGKCEGCTEAAHARANNGDMKVLGVAHGRGSTKHEIVNTQTVNLDEILDSAVSFDLFK